MIDPDRPWKAGDRTCFETSNWRLVFGIVLETERPGAENLTVYVPATGTIYRVPIEDLSDPPATG